MRIFGACIATICLLSACDGNTKAPESASDSVPQINGSEATSLKLSEHEIQYIQLVIDDDVSLAVDNSGQSITKGIWPFYTGDEIVKDYQSNEIRANDKYKGKWFFVTGKVKSIDADPSDKPVIRLESRIKYGLDSPMLYLSEDDLALAAKLNKGDSITWNCMGNSELAGTPVLVGCAPIDSFKKILTTFIPEFNQQYDQDAAYTQINQFALNAIYVAKQASFATNGFTTCKPSDEECVSKAVEKLNKDDSRKIITMLSKQYPVTAKTLQTKIKAASEAKE